MSHNEYERHLPGRRKRDYEPAQFKPYWPVEPEQAGNDTGEDELMALAIRNQLLAEQAMGTAGEQSQSRSGARNGVGNGFGSRKRNLGTLRD